MKSAMISFTGNGRRLERSLAHELEKEGHQVLQAVKCKELESDKDAVKCSAREWTGEQFRTRDVLIFIGAVQIAVRLIASFIGSKIRRYWYWMRKDNIVSRSCPGTLAEQMRWLKELQRWQEHCL